MVIDYDQLGRGVIRPFEGRAQLGDEVASYVRDLIMTGQLRGDEYIRLDKLASLLGVSATPVREALMSLRAEGFLELIPRKGFLVLPLSARDVKDVFDAQATIAGELAARAVDAMDDVTLERLRGIQNRIVEASGREDIATIEQENYQFHKEINVLAGSPKLLWLLGMVMHYSPRPLHSHIEGWASTSIEDHADILEALENRDARRANEAMAAHIINAGRKLIEFLGTLDDRMADESVLDAIK
jgi:DNA-binding GntR family transcriptional regulator